MPPCAQRDGCASEDEGSEVVSNVEAVTRVTGVGKLYIAAVLVATDSD